MNKLDLFIYLIIFVKLIFIGSTILNKILSLKDKKKYHEIIEKTDYFRERTEFVFVILMSILLIYIFNPHHTKRVPINSEMRLLLFLYGWVMILTAKWDIFFSETKWLQPLFKKLGINFDNDNNNSQNKNTHSSQANTNANANASGDNYMYNNVNPYDSNVYTAYYANAAYTGNTITQLPLEPQSTEDKKKKVEKKVDNYEETSTKTTGI